MNEIMIFRVNNSKHAYSDGYPWSLIWRTASTNILRLHSFIHLNLSDWNYLCIISDFFWHIRCGRFGFSNCGKLKIYCTIRQYFRHTVQCTCTFNNEWYAICNNANARFCSLPSIKVGDAGSKFVVRFEEGKTKQLGVWKYSVAKSMVLYLYEWLRASTKPK